MKNHAVWQISGKAARRAYAKDMLRYGVALIGPGDAGRWASDRDDEDFNGGQVRRFASELQVGDAVLLRTGARTICALGLVAGPYEYLELFDDVNGLDLQHTRRVRWFELPQEHVFDEAASGWTAAVTRVTSPSVLDYASRFLNSPPTHWQTAPLPQLPAEEPALEMAPPGIENIMAMAQDLLPLFGDPRAFGDQPTEDELVAHFAVPLLRAMGWPPERIGIQWRRIDIALFDRLPRSSETCRYVIEAKRLTAGVDGALEQAQGYVLQIGSPRDIVVTDGVRYRLFDAANDYAPAAYANLARPKRSASVFFEKLSHR